MQSIDGLETADWDSSKVTSFEKAFYTCTGLTSIDLRTWDLSSVESLEDMFAWCIKLTSVKFNSTNVSKNSFTLADSRKIIIKSLPVGARYEIRETDTGGVRFNTFSINEKGVVLREAEKNKVVFSNQRFTLPQTGGDGAAIGLVVAAAALMLGAYLIFEAVRKIKQVRKP